MVYNGLITKGHAYQATSPLIIDGDAKQQHAAAHSGQQQHTANKVVGTLSWYCVQ